MPTQTTQTSEQHPPGATIHLGGQAYASPSLEPLLTPIDKVTPYPGNPRRHDQDNITGSVRDVGLYAAVVVQASTGHIIVGNGRHQALLDLGATVLPVVVQDVNDARAAAIVARDNQTSDASTNDDQALLDLLSGLSDDADLLALAGYDQDDLTALRAVSDPPPAPAYTGKVDPIQYEPKLDAPPPVTALVDRARANELVRQIRDVPDIPEDVADFLIAGAQRHLVFNYGNVAEFYAHASPEVQALMEASALIIVDYQDAIKHGYVRITEELEQLRGEAIEERAGYDAGAYPDA